MRLKFSDFLALGSFVAWFINHMKLKKKWASWLFGVVCFGSILYIIFDRDRESVPNLNSGTANTSGQITQSIGANNSGQIGQIAGSPGASVNFGLKPYISEVLLVSNTFENGLYVATFKIMVKNPPQDEIALGYTPQIGTVSIDHAMGASGVAFGAGPPVPFVTLYSIFRTINKIQASDVVFWITNAPAKH